MTPRARILFVDDEQQVLDGLSGSLWRSRKTWDMTFVCGGPAAIAALDLSRFDAVVTDMRMPLVDGEAVLLATRAHHPGTIRVILSGQTDRSVTSRTTAVAHQFLAKPCSADELRECLETMLQIARPMDERTRDLVCEIGGFSISARSLARLRALFEGTNVDHEAIVRCIELDVGLIAKLMHVASAGFFAKRQRITSVSNALTVLGIDAVRTFVMSMEPDEHSEPTRWLLDHALATAELMIRFTHHERAFLCGALHGLGKLAMLRRFGTSYADALAEAAAPGCHLHLLELERFGISHSVVGAHLVELWGIDPSIGHAIRTHCDPCGTETDDLGLALHAACALSNGAVKVDGRLRSTARFTSWMASAGRA